MFVVHVLPKAMLGFAVLLKPESVLISGAHVTTRGRVGVHGLCCFLEL